jgi:hypothetical protein
MGSSFSRAAHIFETALRAHVKRSCDSGMLVAEVIPYFGGFVERCSEPESNPATEIDCECLFFHTPLK